MIKIKEQTIWNSKLKTDSNIFLKFSSFCYFKSVEERLNRSDQRKTCKILNIRKHKILEENIRK